MKKALILLLLPTILIAQEYRHVEIRKASVTGLPETIDDIYRATNGGVSSIAAGNSGLGQGGKDWLKSWQDTLDFSVYPHYEGNFNYRDAIATGEYIIAAPYINDSVAVVNVATGDISKYAHTGGGQAYFGVVCVNGNAYFAPEDADSILIMNVETGAMHTIAHGQGNDAYRGAIYNGRYVIFVPSSADSIAVIDPSDSSVTYYAHGFADNSFLSGCYANGEVYFFPVLANGIGLIDTSDYSITVYPHGGGTNQTRNGIFDGQYIWLIPFNTNYFYKFDVKQKVYDRVLSNSAIDLYAGCYDGTNFYFTSLASDSVAVYNAELDRFAYYRHGQGTNGLNSALFDGNRVWLIPNNGDNFMAFTPPNFGVDALNTSGNLNVGGKVTIGIVSTDSTVNVDGSGHFTGSVSVSTLTQRDCDYRFKISAEEFTDALALLTAIDSVIHYIRTNPIAGKSEYSFGIIAQDLVTVIPEAVVIDSSRCWAYSKRLVDSTLVESELGDYYEYEYTTDTTFTEPYMYVRWEEIVPLCVQGIRELYARVINIEARLTILEGM